MFDKAKAFIKEHAYMKFYDETKPLYIETDVSRVGLRASLPQQEAIQSVIEMKCWTIVFHDKLVVLGVLV